jgi:hypothetical protein
MDDESVLFGTIMQNNELKDGLVTYMMRKASKVRP